MNEQINSVDFWVDELTKDTEPEHFGLNVNDFYYTAYKHNYSTWMWNRGYNAGLVNLQTKINTYCVPQWTSHETTTFKPIATDTRGYACQFSCSACDCVVSRAHYMRPDQFDYEYCPYCGRPVESEDNNEYDFGTCDKRGAQLTADWFIDEEFYPNSNTLTGRTRLAVNFLYCPCCGEKYLVDDTFDGEWHD